MSRFKPLPQTPLQRRYYWAIVQHAARSVMPGQPARAAELYLHDEFKAQILGYEEVLDDRGAPVVQPISTTSLDQLEFSQFVEAVLAVLVDSGVSLPDLPEELMGVAPTHRTEPLPSPRSKPC